MPRVIKVQLGVASITEAIQELQEYKTWLAEKANQICERLSFLGAMNARLSFSSAIYKGVKDVDVTVDPIENGYVIRANGETVLFLEFGAGVTYGKGHPQAQQFGMGPGTWPHPHYRKVNGKMVANWENPHGWWIPKERGGGHTYGNSPNMAMYNSAKLIQNEVERVAREVFATQ